MNGAIPRIYTSTVEYTVQYVSQLEMKSLERHDDMMGGALCVFKHEIFMNLGYKTLLLK